MLVKTTGTEKQRFTVMLAIMADGSKLPPYVMFEGGRMGKLTKNWISFITVSKYCNPLSERPHKVASSDAHQ